ncbi:MAG: hypothetical protein Q9198_000128 [Flavoplaca austrocitrina]
MAGKYVVNNELTEEALLTPELIQKGTFSVGSPVPVRINDNESGQQKAGNTPKMQYYQKFVEVSYPGGDKRNTPLFQDKKILADSQYWWTRASFAEAAEGKEYIRIVDDDGEEYIGSFADLFAEYPTSMLANVTCTLKFKGEVPADTPLKGNESWRAGLLISMFTPYDAIEVAAPSTGVGQRSISGKKDMVKPGLAKFKRQQN